MMDKWIEIRSLRYDGTIKRRWNCRRLQNIRGEFVFEGRFEADISHTKLGLIKKGTISREYFWTDRWYNVFAFYDPDGYTLRNFYCNISMPPTISDSVVEYVDLELDVIVWPDLTRTVVDEIEFENIKAEMSLKEVELAEAGVLELINVIDSLSFPFNVIRNLET